MSGGIAEVTTRPRRIGRSIAALIAGFFVNVALTLVTDIAMRAIGALPPLQQPMNDAQAALAFGYRTLFAVISAYVVARLAPYRPMQHALIGAAIGMVLATVGAVATRNISLGPHWYSVALIVVALPTGWIGGKFREMQKHP
ncbi:MAG: hypothetical protein JOZ33_11400 [Acidobacteriaceae bacterium]|nr:hypothetical protein [Acidobacteriaceae bacterium]